jgi:spore germination protein GerM
MAANSKKKISISILMPFLVFILFFTIMIWQKYRSSHMVPAAQTQHVTEGGRVVTLYFAEKGSKLAREARVLDPCDDDNECLRSILDELLNGPVGEFEETIPEGTVINTVLIEANQATIEFNKMFSEAMPSGSLAEMHAVYSVVNTVAVNFPKIQSVKINVDGSANVVLHHLDLTEPLLPDYSLEQSSSAASERTSKIPAANKGVSR